MDQVTTDGNLNHRSVALGDGDEPGILQQLGDGDAVDGGNLVGVGLRLGVVRRPEHEWRDDVAGAGRIVVETPKKVIVAQFQPDLFGDLPHRCFQRGFTLVDSPAGQRPLVGV